MRGLFRECNESPLPPARPAVLTLSHILQIHVRRETRFLLELRPQQTQRIVKSLCFEVELHQQRFEVPMCFIAEYRQPFFGPGEGLVMLAGATAPVYVTQIDRLLRSRQRHCKSVIGRNIHIPRGKLSCPFDTRHIGIC